QYFTQDFNPPLLDILWMIENRSGMNNARSHLITEAQKFFLRLDTLTDDYRMGITTTDTVYYPGLRPNGTVLTKNYGSVTQRVNAFGALISQKINLQTSAYNQGMQSVLNTLQGDFIPRAGVPLVLVFISDSEDSRYVSGAPSVADFASSYLSLKGNNLDLLKVFSVNYWDGSSDRCATQYNSDIDNMPGYAARYFDLADTLSGEKADLCASFGDLIDLQGLRLNELPKRFLLSGKPDPSSIQVKVFLGNQVLPGYSFVYDLGTNEIVFDVTPPEGSTIQVSYLPVG
ncbi:MAG: hypothetical protein KDD51_09925, partial [Bdellovibrionales bacterium]|nr:hypothetical protein [Bdellovibrionales bacterium]